MKISLYAILGASLLILVGCETTSSTSESVSPEMATSTAVEVAKAVQPVVVQVPEATIKPKVVAPVVMETVKVHGEAVAVSRVVANLPSGPMKTLNEADKLLSLSNQQYNDLVALLEERAVKWKSLMSQEKALSVADYKVKKRELFSGYAKKMFALYTPEQIKLWRAR